MAWQQISIIISGDLLDTVEALLHDLQVQAILLYDAEDQPLLEPGPGETPMWEMVKVTGLFSEDHDIDNVHLALKSHWPEATIIINKLADQNWTRAWMDHFKPMQFGENLWICPTHETLPDSNATVVSLDPGMAFGTGTHHTTSMCLEWLATHDVQDKTILDYGCGSGILAIATLKLGAAKAWCVDNDPQALLATHDNANQNNINKAAIEIVLPADCPEIQVDLVIANILASALVNLAPVLTKHTTANGQIVMSGILHHQAQSVIDAYPQFAFEQVIRQDDWVCLSAKKTS